MTSSILIDQFLLQNYVNIMCVNKLLTLSFLVFNIEYILCNYLPVLDLDLFDKKSVIFCPPLLLHAIGFELIIMT